MQALFRKNTFYFTCLFLFLVVGTLFFLFIDKPEGILFFSKNRSAVANESFKFITRLGEEPAYILVAILFLLYKIRNTVLVALTGFTVMALSYGLKAYFRIDRPLAYFNKLGMSDSINYVNGIDLHQGATSFPSGHSMGAFALFSLTIFLLPNKKAIVLPLFLIAVLVALSRVYLVQHFYVDIYAGSLLGAVVAMLFYLLDRQLKLSSAHFLERPLLRPFWRKGKKD